MFEFIRAIGTRFGRPSEPEEAKVTAKEPINPIISLTSRSTWAINSIKSAIESLASQNVEINQEHDVRESAKAKLQEEQNALRNIRSLNETVIAKAQQIFETPKP